MLSQSTSPFYCQPSSGQSGMLFYTPNIPDSFFNHNNIQGSTVTLSSGTTLIFTLPPESPERNCSGTVQMVEFCYQVGRDNLGNSVDVLNLLLLTRDGLQFTIGGIIPIRSTPQDNVLCRRVPGSRRNFFTCCDAMTLPSNEQFQLPSSSYTIGAYLLLDEVQLLTFAAASNLEYQYPQLQIMSNNSIQLTTGFSFTLEESNERTQPLPLLRFTVVANGN